MGSWQESYDESIRRTDEAIKRSDAERSTTEKILDRSAQTSTALDLLIVPVVALAHGVAGLVRLITRRSAGAA
ncbi:MAG: hypothetical protein AB7L17_21570 [Ilumatobacteraceae bacterium]